MGLADKAKTLKSKNLVNKTSRQKNILASANSSDKSMNVQTKLDHIYNLVLDKKNVSLPVLATRFNVSNAKIESWAQILDKQKLLDLHYPVIGPPQLRKKNEKSNR